MCVRDTHSNYLLMDLNNAMQHFRTHHQTTNVLFTCSRCKKIYNTKHAALCHIPKCPGAREELATGIQCDACKQFFNTRRGLSQHERAAHPLVRNTKRQDAARPAQPRPPAKGYGKIWTKADVDRMLRLEVQLQGHPRVAKEMTAYFPGKTAKQIRDKRKETSYKQLLQAHLDSVETVSSPLTQATVPDEDCDPQVQT